MSSGLVFGLCIILVKGYILKKVTILCFVDEAPFSDSDDSINNIIFPFPFCRDDLPLVFMSLFQYYRDFTIYDSDDSSRYDGRMETEYVNFEFTLSVGVSVDKKHQKTRQ